MKILNLSLDNTALDLNSKTAKKIAEYGGLIDEYVVAVPSRNSAEKELSYNTKAYGSGGRSKAGRFIRLNKLAKKLLKKEKFDLITVQDQYYLALMAWILAKKNNIGLEIQVHGFEKFSGLRKITAKFVIPKASAIRCVSQRLKNQLIKDFGVQEGKITVTSIYVETKDSLGAAGTERKILNGSGQFVFLTVGRLVPVKNIGLQIKAMAEVAKDYPSAELWIVGKGSEEKRLKRLAEDLKLAKQIKFWGWRDDLYNFYRQADAFLLTSDYEGWGMVIVEAAGYGLPVIMTDVGCAGELIKNNESGLIVPVGDPVKLKEAMIKILEDASARTVLALGAKRAVGNLPGKEETLALYKKSWEKAASNL